MVWWLVPAPTWPAHRHGKLFFSSDRVLTPGELFCGLHVEKGYDPAVRTVLRLPARWILQDDWTWHQLRPDLTSGRLREAIDAVAARRGAPVMLWLECGAARDARDAPAGTEQPEWARGDRVVFECAGQALALRRADTQAGCCATWPAAPPSARRPRPSTPSAGAGQAGCGSTRGSA